GPEPHDHFTDCPVTNSSSQARQAWFGNAETRPDLHGRAWSVGCSRLELLLLSCNPEDERRDGNHLAIYCSRLGASVHGCAQVTKTDGSTCLGSRSGAIWHRV